MEQLQSNIKREVTCLLPKSLHADITCVAFYDNHPNDAMNLDIIVGTKQCQIKEFYKRLPAATYTLNDNLVPREIVLHRNSKNELFYLVFVFEKLHILKRSESISLLKIINNVDKFVIDDPECTGMSHLRIWLSDDAVPVVYDDNFSVVPHNLINTLQSDENSDFISCLRVKLNEIKYTVAANQMKCEELMKLRQAATFALLNDMIPTSKEELAVNVKNSTSIQLENQTPWMKFCNGQIVLGIEVQNKTDSTLENLSVILQSSYTKSSQYKIKLFEASASTPFWKLKRCHNLAPKSSATLVLTSNIEDFTDGGLIKYYGVILYKVNDKIKYAPFEETELSCLDVIGENFDLLSKNQFDHNEMLAIMNTTEKTELVFEHGSPEDVVESANEEINVFNIIKKHLSMHQLEGWQNVLVFNKSPYHILNGIVLIQDSASSQGLFAVYCRSKSQLMSFITILYKGIPYRILVSTPHSKAILKDTESLPESMEIDDVFSSEENSTNISEQLKVLDFVKNLGELMSEILEYFDKCIILMGESKLPEKSKLVGSQIDLFIGSKDMFLNFQQHVKEKLANLCDIISID